MHFIELNQIIGSSRNDASESELYNTDEPGEGRAAVTSTEPTTPTMVNAASIRCFYRRKDRSDSTPRTGTRITFRDGRGFAVTDTYDVVKALIEGGQVPA